MMTVLGMVFERHGEEFPVVRGGFQPVPIGPSPATTADPCNNVLFVLPRKERVWLGLGWLDGEEVGCGLAKYCDALGIA